jgi:hypothetical protein
MEGGNQSEPVKDELSEFDYHAQSHAAAEVGAAQQYASASQDSTMSIAPDATDDSVVTWEASEYIHHQKAATWYLGLAGIAIIICGLLYVSTEDWFSITVVLLMAVAVGIYAHRAPQVQRYTISGKGLSIGQHHYSINEFSSYQVADEGGVQSLTFTPLKRFMPPVSVYFPPQDGARIMTVLGTILPREERQPDIIDRLMRMVRF